MSKLSLIKYSTILICLMMLILFFVEWPDNKKTSKRMPAKSFEVEVIKEKKVEKIVITKKIISVENNEIEKDQTIVKCKNFDYEDVLNNIMSAENYNGTLKLEDYENQFKIKEDSPHQLAYAMSLDYKNAEKKAKIYSEIVKQEPNNDLAHWNLLLQCENDDDNKECDKSLIESSIKQLQYNGAIWLGRATSAIADDDIEQIILAMNQIITAPTFNDYSQERLEYFDRVYQDQGASISLLRNIASLGVISESVIPAFGPLAKFCKNTSKERADIAQLCLGVGQRLEKSQSSLIYQVMGLSFQKSYYASQNDTEAVKKVLEKKNQKMQSVNSPLSIDAFQLLMLDEELSNYWFQSYVNFGEVKSSELLIEEAIRLSADEGYDPCPVATNQLN